MNRINQIDSMELFVVKLPLVETFETSLAVETHKEAQKWIREMSEALG